MFMLRSLTILISLAAFLGTGEAFGQDEPKAEKPALVKADAKKVTVRLQTLSGQKALKADAPLTALAKELETAADRGTNEDLEKVGKKLSELTAEKSTSWREHFLGLAHWQLASRFEQVNPEQGKKLLVEAGKALEKAVAADPKNAEAHAALAMTLAQRIDMTDMQETMMLAMEAQEHLATARDLEPDNPIILAHAGVFEYFKPEEYGGGPKTSLPLFEAAHKSDPHYGDAMVWLAINRQALGDSKGAKELTKLIAKEHSDNQRLQQLLQVFLQEDF